MNEKNELVMWDWRDQPNWEHINRALSDIENAVIREVETDNDMMAVVVCEATVTQKEAQDFAYIEMSCEED